MEQPFSLAVNMPASYTGALRFHSQLDLLTPVSCQCSPWETVVMDPAVVFLSPAQDTLPMLAPPLPSPDC